MRKLAWASLAIAGTVVVLAVNRLVDGNALTFVHVEQRVWGQHAIAPWSSLVDAMQRLTHPVGHPNPNFFLVLQGRLAAAAFAVGVLAWGWKRLRMSDRVYAVGSLGVCLSASRLISLPRYLLPIYPITSILAWRSSDRRIYTLLVAGGIVAQVLLFARYANGLWAF